MRYSNPKKNDPFLGHDRAHPCVVLNHRVERREREYLSILNGQLYGALFLQLGVDFRTHLLQICLGDIEHIEYLILRINIVLLFFPRWIVSCNPPRVSSPLCPCR